MKIDLPIVILFDCQATDPRSIAAAAGKIVGTLQYDTDGDGRDALFFPTYPPPESFDAKYVESGQSILAHIPSETDKKVNARAARSPYDYMVGSEAERLIAQDEADEERAANGQHGVGA
jgi:hypothetical protein